MEAECRAMDFDALESCSIPNVGHFVWYSGNEFRLDHYLSARSIYNALKPDAIFVHGREFPDRNLHLDRAFFFSGSETGHVSGDFRWFWRTCKNHDAQGDILRMETLIRLGGMYFDSDISSLKLFFP